MKLTAARISASRITARIGISQRKSPIIGIILSYTADKTKSRWVSIGFVLFEECHKECGGDHKAEAYDSFFGKLLLEYDKREYYRDQNA